MLAQRRVRVVSIVMCDALPQKRMVEGVGIVGRTVRFILGMPRLARGWWRDR